MNGRIYDPLFGRFLSADTQVQFPSSLQSYNRYSYVRNNPLTSTDPSGWQENGAASVAPVSGMAQFEVEVLTGDLKEAKDASEDLGEANARGDGKASDAARGRLNDVMVRQGINPNNPRPVPACELRPGPPEPAEAARNQTEAAADRVDTPKPAAENLKDAAPPETGPTVSISFDKPAAGGQGTGNAPSVYRYVGPEEAQKAKDTNVIPNTDAQGNPKAVYVTPDKHETADSAQEGLQIGKNDPRGPQQEPTHRIEGNAAGVKFDTAGKVDGPSGTQTGTELTTRAQIPVVRIDLLKKPGDPANTPAQP